MGNMVFTIKELSEEEKIAEQCFAREDYQRRLIGAERGGYKQGIEQGISQGIDLNVIDIVIKKVKKAKNLTQIADELEEDVEVVKVWYEAVVANPGKTADEIYRLVCGEK